MSNNYLNAPVLSEKMPRGIPYIIGNEAAERFSFYGMKGILVIFMTQYLFLLPGSGAEAMSRPAAMENYHLFTTAVYFFPIIGALLADIVLGKYLTIMLLSVVYCAGHGVLAMMGSTAWLDMSPGIVLAIGLVLISVGSGGIKPCVSAHVGDQFKPSQKEALNKVFNLFYFMINFGSFFSTMITPWTLEAYGPGIAFGIPGVLMAVATFIFWLGRNKFVHVPPTGQNPHSTTNVLLSAVKNFGKRGDNGVLGGALIDHPEKAVNDVNAAMGIVKVFAAISVFWALFDQHGSSWVLQAKEMNLNVDILGWKTTLLPSQIPGLNPIMVMALIPIFTFGIYPFIEKKLGIKMTSLRKMGAGMFVASISFVVVAACQYVLDGGTQLSVLWQVIPFLLITVAEVMVSIPGLEFAYTQAPRTMKSTVMSMWLLTVFFGNMITAYVANVNIFDGGNFFMFFAILMGVFAILFAVMAKGYKVQDNMEA